MLATGDGGASLVSEYIAMSDCRSRDEMLLDHLVNLTEQVRLLGEACRVAGINVPAFTGTLGPADPDVMERLMRESIARHQPDLNLTWELFARDETSD